MSKSDRPRKWRRWVGISISYYLRALVDIARNNGMECITAFKPCLFFYNHIGLYGTSAMMTKTESDWRKDKKIEIKNRQPSGCFGIAINIAKDEWAENALKASGK
jgi:hypothetical protein